MDHSDLTSGAAELTTLAGALDSFALAIEAKVAFDEARAWDWHKDAEGVTCAYVPIDLTGVAKQGPAASAADGEMIAVGMVYNPAPEDRRQWADPGGRRPDWQARYVASLEGQEAVAEPLRHMAGRVGMGDAQRWIAVCDGGSGLEDLLKRHSGRLDAVILDFDHASEHPGDFAKAYHPGDAAAAGAAHAAWSHRLKHEGGQAVLELLEGLDLDDNPRARPAREEVVTYFRNQVDRMDYPSYRAKGWQIGSGPVEAACKAVIGRRMKGSGMRWGHEGADAVGHLRALLLSDAGQWDAFWANRRTAA